MPWHDHHTKLVVVCQFWKRTAITSQKSQPLSRSALVSVWNAKLGLQAFAHDVFHEIDDSVGVTPLIVVPAHELEELVVQLKA